MRIHLFKMLGGGPKGGPGDCLTCAPEKYTHCGPPIRLFTRSSSRIGDKFICNFFSKKNEKKKIQIIRRKLSTYDLCSTLGTIDSMSIFSYIIVFPIR